MVATRLLTKKDLIELVEETFPDVTPTKVIGVLTTIHEDEENAQQCILLSKEVNN